MQNRTSITPDVSHEQNQIIAIGPVGIPEYLDRPQIGSARSSEPGCSRMMSVDGETYSKDFIKEASKSYAHARENDMTNVPQLLHLYSRVSQMRIFSSQTVIDQADRVMTIVNRGKRML